MRKWVLIEGSYLVTVGHISVFRIIKKSEQNQAPILAVDKYNI